MLAQLNIQNPLGGAVFGFTALGFVYAYSILEEEGFPAAIVNVVDLNPLGIVRNNVVPGETPERACLRHLRNCFAHGRYEIQVVNNNQDVEITLHDETQAGAPTFDAHCAAAEVADLAERVLVECHNYAAAIANPPAAGQAGGAQGAPAAPLAAAGAPGPVAGNQGGAGGNPA